MRWVETTDLSADPITGCDPCCRGGRGGTDAAGRAAPEDGPGQPEDGRVTDLGRGPVRSGQPGAQASRGGCRARHLLTKEAHARAEAEEAKQRIHKLKQEM